MTGGQEGGRERARVGPGESERASAGASTWASRRLTPPFGRKKPNRLNPFVSAAIGLSPSSKITKHDQVRSEWTRGLSGAEGASSGRAAQCCTRDGWGERGAGEQQAEGYSLC